MVTDYFDSEKTAIAELLEAAYVDATIFTSLQRVKYASEADFRTGIFVIEGESFAPYEEHGLRIDIGIRYGVSESDAEQAETYRTGMSLEVLDLLTKYYIDIPGRILELRSCELNAGVDKSSGLFLSWFYLSISIVISCAFNPLGELL